MADEHVDALLLSARFDPSGLEAIPGAVNQALRDAQQGIPELEFIDAAELRAQLEQSGADVSGFFSGVRTELTATITDSAQLAAALSAVDALELTFGGGDAGAILASAAAAEKLAAEASAASTATDDLNASSLALTNNLGNLSGTLGRAAGQASSLAAGFEAASNQRSVANLAAISGTMGQAARQTSSWATGLAALAAQQKSTVAATDKASVAFGGAAANAKRAATSLGLLAAQSVGVSGPLGQLAQTALIFSGGVAGLATAAIGVLALAKAYEFLTKSEREAAAATDERREALDKLALAQKGPVVQAQDQFSGQQATVDALEASLKRVSEARKALAADPTALGDPATLRIFNSLLEQESSLTKQLAADKDRLGTATNALAEAESEAARARTSLVESLGRELAVLELGADRASELEARQTGGAGAEALQKRINAIKAAIKAEAELERMWAASNAQQRENEAALKATEQALRDLAKAYSSDVFQALQKSIDALDEFRANAAASVDGLLTAQEIIDEIQAARVGRLTDAAGAGDLGGALAGSEELRDAFAKVVAGIQRATAEAKLLAAATKAARSEAEIMADTLTDFGSAAFALADVGSALGIIGDEAARSLEDVGRLADSLAQLSLNASTGNILGAIVSGATLLGGLFSGGGPSESDRLLAENNERLAELTNSLANLDTAAGTQATAGTLAKLSAPFEGLFSDGKLVGSLQDLTAAGHSFDAALAASGLTLEEFAAQVKDQTGLDILNDKGELVASTLAQADEAFQKIIDDITHFSDTLAAFDEQTTTAENLGLIARSEDPRVAQLQHVRDVQLEGLVLDPATEARIRGLDLETIEGREEFLKFQRDLFKRAQAGGLSPEELGKFGDVDELGRSINDAAEGINEFDDAVTAATKSLTNIPDTFKLASAEFSVRDADIAAPATAFTGPLVNSTQAVQPVGTAATATTTPGTVFTGEITISVVVPQGMSPGDVARRVKAELEAEAQADFGLRGAP